MKSFKQFLLEMSEEEEDQKNDETPDQDDDTRKNQNSEDEEQLELPGKDAAEEIDKQYTDLKTNEDRPGSKGEALKSTDVNPNKVSATDDYNYWKDALVGKKGNADAEHLYDWMWRAARQKAYPWQEEKRQAIENEPDKYGYAERKDILLPKSWEAPIPTKDKEYNPEQDKRQRENQIRDAMQGAKEEDIQRVIQQSEEDLANTRYEVEK